MSDFVGTYEAAFTANFCGVAVVTVLVFDWIISLGSEVNLVWRAPKTSASLLYIFNRYCIMLAWFVGIVTIQPVSDLRWIGSYCRGLYWSEVALENLAMLGPALFSSLRVYALSGQHRVLTGLTLCLALMPFFVNVSTNYQSHPVNLDAPYNCYLDSTTSPTMALARKSTVTKHLTFLSRSSSTLADLIAIAVTWWTTYWSSRLAADTLQGPTFHQIVLYNGSIYFVVLATLNILHIVLTALSFKLPSGSESYMINFIDPIASILVCRFLLSLQEAKRNASPSSDTTPSFIAPEFAGSASQLPSFVAPLGGLVHASFSFSSSDSFLRSGLDFEEDTASEIESRGSDSTAIVSGAGNKGSVSSMEGSVAETPV
ncbi:hypothetical protein K466DRAFT_667118 [Polyporus arcularius HHB13444]|uniref:DUF6533 domain-containing protein n=1 Tax=Polyporus arcularius HHB13444 TaxID=1314778 RepID=A0A5C3NZH3_9APHY|nr:hypothetical protein K466DRAFT_667118 [Polyporus arcularius HHB13444]